MPNRIIRESILSSEPVSRLKWPEEVFYRRLLSIVDDYGRTEANPLLLRSKCYPLQTDVVRVADISCWLAACQTTGLILVYTVENKAYLEVAKFNQRARTESKFPSPSEGEPAFADKCAQMPANARLGVFVFGGEGVVEGGGGKRRHAPQALSFARKGSNRPTQEEVEAFVISLGLPQSDGEYMYLNWCEKDWKNVKNWELTIRKWKSAGYMPSQKQKATNGGLVKEKTFQLAADEMPKSDWDPMKEDAPE